jgi:tRNA pseudouridine13 synthase
LFIKDFNPLHIQWHPKNAYFTGDPREPKIIDAHPELTAGLLKFALEMDRRALRGYPENLHWQYVDANQLQISFFLTAGSYATALLRELIHFS